MQFKHTCSCQISELLNFIYVTIRSGWIHSAFIHVHYHVNAVSLVTTTIFQSNSEGSSTVLFLVYIVAKWISKKWTKHTHTQRRKRYEIKTTNNIEFDIHFCATTFLIMLFLLLHSCRLFIFSGIDWAGNSVTSLISFCFVLHTRNEIYES